MKLLIYIILFREACFCLPYVTVGFLATITNPKAISPLAIFNSGGNCTPKDLISVQSAESSVG